MSEKQRRILVVGGGFGGLFTALELARTGDVTLVDGRDHFTFTPLLYEYLSGEVEAWHIAPNFDELLGDDVRFIRGEVESVDFDAREVAIAGRSRKLGYDVLVLAAGSTNNFFDIAGAREYALPFRTIDDADRVRRKMVESLDAVAPDAAPQDASGQVTFAIVGGGASGVEVATKMADLLNDGFTRRGLPGVPRVMVIEMGDRIVPGMGADLREYVLESLREARVEVHTETRVTQVTNETIRFEHNGAEQEIKVAGVVWTAGVRVAPLIERLELPKDGRGRIVVADTLQTTQHKEVFVLGDVARFENIDPKLSGTSQLAVQQSTLAASNIEAYLRGEQLETKHFVEMGEAVSLGTQRAAVESPGGVVQGALARQARFAFYTSRLPTWHHRLRVGASWFVTGTRPQPL